MLFLQMHEKLKTSREVVPTLETSLTLRKVHAEVCTNCPARAQFKLHYTATSRSSRYNPLASHRVLPVLWPIRGIEGPVCQISYNPSSRHSVCGRSQNPDGQAEGMIAVVYGQNFLTPGSGERLGGTGSSVDAL